MTQNMATQNMLWRTTWREQKRLRDLKTRLVISEIDNGELVGYDLIVWAHQIMWVDLLKQ